MWYEYPIPANLQKQREVIRKLRQWIQSLESRGLVQGFAFNHYYGNPNASDILSIRFDCMDKKKLEIVKKELEREVKRLIPNYVLEERLWDAGKSPDYIYKAYELGSRCTFLVWELIKKGRIPENYLSDYRIFEKQIFRGFRGTPLQFQAHFNHGLMNSLGIHKMPNEQWIHLLLLKESTQSRNVEELCRWIRNQPSMLFPENRSNETT